MNVRDGVDIPDFMYADEDYDEALGEEVFLMGTDENAEYKEAEEDRLPVGTLIGWTSSNNIAPQLSDTRLAEIGELVCDEFKIDELSRKSWRDDNELALKLARLVKKSKTFPWPGAANVMYPLILQAAVQFNARAYPSIVNDGRIVKGRIVGKDPDNEKKKRAARVSSHMNYQLENEMPGWEDELDTLTLVLPIVGSAFRKTYRDHLHNRNASDLVLAEDVVINYAVPSIDRAVRITHIKELYPNEIEEYIRSGLFLKFDYAIDQPAPSDPHEEIKVTDDGEKDPRDPDVAHIFYEQHRLLDLDNDGYKEPYTVTVHSPTRKVCRIVTRYGPDDITVGADMETVIRIKAENHWTAYKFLPSVDGSIYGLGFGLLLGSTNKTINSTINQLLDAGTNANAGGGFISETMSLVRGKVGATMSFAPNEFKRVRVSGGKLSDSVMMRPVQQPSLVLFKLLDFMISSSKIIANFDLLGGEMPPANTPATTTMALVDQSMRVFSTVYKRLYRSLKDEMNKLFTLNSIYLDDEEYFTITDEEGSVARTDYDTKSCDVIPECDPNNVSSTIQSMKAEAMMAQKGDPGLNSQEINKYYFESLNIPDPERFIIPAEDINTETPEETLEKMKLELEGRKVAILEKKFGIFRVHEAADITKTGAEVEEIRAKIVKLLSEAKAADNAEDIEKYQAIAEALNGDVDILELTIKNMTDAMKNNGGGSDGTSNERGPESVEEQLGAAVGAGAAGGGASGVL